MLNLLEAASIKWCSICNKAPADGTATVIDEDDQMIDLPMCLKCVRGAAGNDANKLGIAGAE